MKKMDGGGVSRTAQKPGTRAVLRFIMPGDTENCAHCGEPLRFRAKIRLKKVICNVYKRGRWNRVEHFHDSCYAKAGKPYGPVDVNIPRLGRQGSRGW